MFSSQVVWAHPYRQGEELQRSERARTPAPSCFKDLVVVLASDKDASGTHSINGFLGPSNW